MKRSIARIGIALLGAAVLGGAAAVAAETDPVLRAIDKGKKLLLAKVNRWGHWESRNRPPKDAGHWGGVTCLNLTALLYAGETVKNEKVKRALDWICTWKSKSTYTLGCKAWALSLAEPRKHPKYAKALRDTVRQLYVNMGKKTGWFTYGPVNATREGGDHSNTQFGVLGFWAAAKAGVEIDRRKVWDVVLKHWVSMQHKDGGWSYKGGGGTGRGHGGPGRDDNRSSGKMTSAAVASLYVVWRNAYANSGGAFNGRSCSRCGRLAGANLIRMKKSIDTGLDWLDRQFRVSGGNWHPYPGWVQYWLMCLERVGLASGYKYFNGKDWFRGGAKYLISRQRASGSMGDTDNDFRNTAMGLIFLTRGVPPVMFNKLIFDGWDNQPWDCDGLAAFFKSKFERPVTWQAVNLSSNTSGLHDSPVLYMTAHAVPELSGPQKNALRDFVLEGGMILGVACCGRVTFIKGFEALAAELFPKLEMSELPEDHPVYTIHYKVRPRKYKLKGMGNGLRTYMLLVPRGINAAWAQRLERTYRDMFELGTNIYMLASDRASLRTRLSTHVVREKAGVKPKGTIRIARLQYAGRWDPEPYAWRRLSNVVFNATGFRVEAKATAITADALAGVKLAHLTGLKSPDLSAEQTTALADWLAGGGTLIIDSAGGREAFDEGVRDVIRKLAPGKMLTQVGLTDPLIAGGFVGGVDCSEVKIRRAAFARWGLTKSPNLLVVRDGKRVQILYSPVDLTVGMVGMPCYGCAGYGPDDSTNLMKNAVLVLSNLAKTATKSP